MVSLPENLEKRLEVLKEVWETLELREEKFCKKIRLEKLSSTVYADNKLVYKMDPHSTEEEALRRVKDIERVQKFVAFDYGILVSERIQEKHYKPRSKVKRIHLKNLLRTIITLRNRCVSFYDCHELNMFYSAQHGFTLIDLTCEKFKPNVPIHDLAETFSARYYETPIRSTVLSNYANIIEVFHEVDSKLAFKTLKNYILLSERDLDSNVKKINKNSLQFKQMQSALNKYGLKFDDLYCDEWGGLMFLG